MYLICLAPWELDVMDDFDFRRCNNEGEVNEHIKELAAHNPNKVIYTFKLQKKSACKINVDITNYVMNDNGEVLPE